MILGQTGGCTIRDVAFEEGFDIAAPPLIEALRFCDHVCRMRPLRPGTAWDLEYSWDEK